MTIIFPDTIPWDDETQWRKFNPSPVGWPAEGNEPRRWPLADMPDGTIFKDERGHEYGKVAGKGVGRVVVVNDEGFFCMFDGRLPFIFADPSKEPREKYRVVVEVNARDAEEAHKFIEDMLGDIRWDRPLEVASIGRAFREDDIPSLIAEIEKSSKAPPFAIFHSAGRREEPEYGWWISFDEDEEPYGPYTCDESEAIRTATAEFKEKRAG